MLSLGKKISEDQWHKSQVAKLVTMYDNVMHTKSVQVFPSLNQSATNTVRDLQDLCVYQSAWITSGVWNNSQKVKQET